jgi:predicted anti-sigma-YlaC factor YlaD
MHIVLVLITFPFIAEFAETTLAGKSIPGGLRSIEEHLKICGECREEFETLKDALSREAIE